MIRAGRIAAVSMAVALAAAPYAFAGKAKQPPDLSGRWLLDRSRSELPGSRGGRGGWGRGPRDGERLPGEERGPADSTRGAGRAGRLPDRIQIRETPGRVLLSDSAGAALVEVLTGAGGRAAGGSDAMAAVLQLDGTWKGDRLEVERTGPRGGTMKETYRLEDKGRTLVVETKVESNGRRPAMTFKRVYVRAGA